MEFHNEVTHLCCYWYMVQAGAMNTPTAQRGSGSPYVSVHPFLGLLGAQFCLRQDWHAGALTCTCQWGTAVASMMQDCYQERVHFQYVGGVDLLLDNSSVACWWLSCMHPPGGIYVVAGPMSCWGAEVPGGKAVQLHVCWGGVGGRALCRP
jgi:hypothetical protein